LSKEKYPKEKTPECRLFPALLAFAEGFRKGLPAPSATRRILRRPYGLFPTKAPVLGAAYGVKALPKRKLKPPRLVKHGSSLLLGTGKI